MKQNIIDQYVSDIRDIYGNHIKRIILYGSYVRGDFHKDTLAYFNKQYIATEIFSRDMGRRIVKAEDIRHASNYDAFYIASKNVTKQQIETAEQLLKLAKEYYNEKQHEL